MTERLRVTVWGENVHERENPLVHEIYPKGMHMTIADGIAENNEFDVRTATLQDPQHGLTKKVWKNTEDLFGWGKAGQGKVKNEMVEGRLTRVGQGMVF